MSENLPARWLRGACAKAKAGPPGGWGRKRGRALVVSAGLALWGTVGAWARVDHGESRGTALSADLNLVGVLPVDTGDLATAAGSAPPAYSVTKNAVPLNVNAGVPGVISLLGVTGTGSAAASSTVDGTPGAKSAAGSGRVENLALNVADLPDLLFVTTPPLITLNAAAVGTASSVAGDGDLTGAGSFELTNLQLKISGVTVNLNLPGNVLPNTQIDLNAFGLAGARLFLNELAEEGDAHGRLRRTRTALRLQLTGVQVGALGLLSGDVVVGRSMAELSTDSDGDGVTDDADADDDGDGIPDATEAADSAALGGDTDGDGVPNARDLDSDNDGINDVVEGGGTDANGDGRQDGTTDADGDGLVDTADPNRGGTALPLPDSDGDGVRDYVDLDSDNDGLSDYVESGAEGAETDADGVANGPDTDGDGIVDVADAFAGFGDANSPAPRNSDGDSLPDYIDPDSDNDTIPDIDESGQGDLDGDGDGRIDSPTDSDHDGVPDVVDQEDDDFGGLPNPGGDTDGDGATNGEEGNGGVDTDGDGVPDSADADSDNDGIPDATEISRSAANAGDTDGDGVPDRRDLDSDNDGLNDTVEAGGTDEDGNGFADGFVDANGNGLNDTLDPATGGTALPLPDSDGDSAADYTDLDSDNDTVSDLLEGGSGAADADHDGVADGNDPDGDGIASSADGLPAAFGDAGGTQPVDTDGDGTPDFTDTDSDDAGAPDIVTAGNGALDQNGDGRADGPFTDADHDGLPTTTDTDDGAFGGIIGCLGGGADWRAVVFSPAELADESVSGWLADPDGDGADNALEFASGTDPKDSSERPSLASIISESSGQLLIDYQFQRDPCHRAFVGFEFSTDLVTWTTTPPNAQVTQESGNLFTVRLTVSKNDPQPQRGFVRLRVSVP